MIEPSVLMKTRYATSFQNFKIVPERASPCKIRKISKIGPKDATDMWILTLNRRHFDGSKAVIKSKNMFRFH